MIYIIIEYDLFEYAYVRKNGDVYLISDNAVEIRRELKSKGMSFKTLREAKEYRAESPVFGNVKFYDVKKKKEARNEN